MMKLQLKPLCKPYLNPLQLEQIQNIKNLVFSKEKKNSKEVQPEKTYLGKIKIWMGLLSILYLVGLNQIPLDPLNYLLIIYVSCIEFLLMNMIKGKQKILEIKLQDHCLSISKELSEPKVTHLHLESINQDIMKYYSLLKSTKNGFLYTKLTVLEKEKLSVIIDSKGKKKDKQLCQKTFINLFPDISELLPVSELMGALGLGKVK